MDDLNAASHICFLIRNLFNLRVDAILNLFHLYVDAILNKSMTRNNPVSRHENTLASLFWPCHNINVEIADLQAHNIFTWEHVVSL